MRSNSRAAHSKAELACNWHYIAKSGLVETVETLHMQLLIIDSNKKPLKNRCSSIQDGLLFFDVVIITVRWCRQYKSRRAKIEILENPNYETAIDKRQNGYKHKLRSAFKKSKLPFSAPSISVHASWVAKGSVIKLIYQIPLSRWGIEHYTVCALKVYSAHL